MKVLVCGEKAGGGPANNGSTSNDNIVPGTPLDHSSPQV